MIDLEQYVTGLVERDGIFSANKKSEISYPESGNDEFSQIEEISFWFPHRNNCIIESVKKYCPDNVFFDIGAGNGFVAKGLEENGIQAIAMEPGIQGCLNAKKRNLKYIICSTFENVFFVSGSVPSIGVFDVVEHIKNDVDFLSSIYVSLKENGYIFINVPAFKTLWSNEDVILGHYRRYILKDLEHKLKDVGFTIEYSTYIFSFLPIPIFLFRTLPYRLGLNNKSNDKVKRMNEFKKRKGLVDKVVNRICEFELSQIKKGKKIPFGSSCFVIARKTASK